MIVGPHHPSAPYLLLGGERFLQSAERHSDDRDLDALRRRPAGQLERGLHLVDPEGVGDICGKQLGMLAGELVGGTQHRATVQCHTGFQGQVVAQHRAHADRVAVVVGHTEVEDGAAERGRFDRMAERGDLVADGLDDDVRPVVWVQVAHPAVACRADHGVDAELLGDAVAVDRVDAGDMARAQSLCRIGEQQPDRALPDDGDVAALECRATARAHRAHRPGAAAPRHAAGSVRDRMAPTRRRRSTTYSIKPSNPEAQPTTRSPTPWLRWRLAITSPTISWIGKPSISAALVPASPGSLPFAPRKPGRSLPHTPAARNRSST